MQGMNGDRGSGLPDPDDTPEDLIDAKAAAKVLKLALPVLHRWRMAGKVRSWKRGGRYFFSRVELVRQFRRVDNGAVQLPLTEAERRRRHEASMEELRRRGWLPKPPGDKPARAG